MSLETATVFHFFKKKTYITKKSSVKKVSESFSVDLIATKSTFSLLLDFFLLDFLINRCCLVYTKSQIIEKCRPLFPMFLVDFLKYFALSQPTDYQHIVI